MMGFNFVMMVVELVCGVAFKSMTLTADAFHMTSDILALGIAFASLRIAQRRRDAVHTFGWVRAEVLGALINSVFLLSLCLSVLIEAVKRFAVPEPLENLWVVLGVGIAGLVVNIVGLAALGVHSHHGSGHSSHQHHGSTNSKPKPVKRERWTDDSSVVRHSYQGRAISVAYEDAGGKEESNTTSKTPNLNIKGAFLHVLSDAAGSVIVIIAASICLALPDVYWLKLYLDPALSIVLVLFIAVGALPLVRETAMILLQTTPSFVNVDAMKFALYSIDGVTAVHEFHVWRLVGDCVIATVHIRFESLDDYLKAGDRIQAIFHESGVHSVTLQPEFGSNTSPSSDECATACETPKCVPTGVQCCDTNSSKSAPPLPPAPLTSSVEPSEMPSNV
uniref:Zinc transporter 1 n=1 Tax=Panagrellus redivivus TaxID=6233 RepID=A0A7E4W2R7_PANRE